MTTSLSSSLDVVSLTSSTRWASDSPSDEDEIVWSLASSASPPLQSPLSETGDFVLVPRLDTSTATAAAPSASPIVDTIADEMATLSLTPAAHARGNADSPASPSTTVPGRRAPIKGATTTNKSKRSSGQQAGTATATTTRQQQQPRQQAPTAPPAAPRKKCKKGTKKNTRGSSPGSASSASSAHLTPPSPDARPSRSSAGKSPAKSGGRPPAGGVAPATTGRLAVVDDSVSEASEASSAAAAAGYQEAQKYMTSYLAHPPPPGNNGSALLMLQALILELGCLPGVAASKFSIPQLPATLRQAKLLLKSHAFINVRDYLAVREQGQAALQRVMHSSRTSLVKEVRKGKRMPVGEVKRAGLRVLLVNTRS